MENVHKTYTELETLLVKELTELRKGIGLTPAKLKDKEALKALGSRLTNLPEARLTGSRLHALLLAELEKAPSTRNVQALRNAYNLGQRNTATLSARRTRLAVEWTKHPDTIERYENYGAAELASHLITLQSDDMTSTAPLKQTYLQRLEDQVAKARAATALGLSGILSINQRAEELITLLESSPRPFLDTQIEIAFLPSTRGENWYRMTVVYTFQGVRENFRLAVVTHTEDGALLMKRGLIDEFHKLNDQISPTRETRGVINNNRLTLRNPDTGQQKLLRFREATPTQTQHFLQSVGERLQGSCRLLEINTPLEWRQPHTTYEYYSSINLRDDIHYAYWYAPSLMYVKKLSFDYSKFPGREKWQFTILPFLGHITGDVLNPNDRSFVLHPNSWIVQGHGIGLIWE